MNTQNQKIDTSAYHEVDQERHDPKARPDMRGIMDFGFGTNQTASCAETGEKIRPGNRFLLHNGAFYSSYSKKYDSLVTLDMPIFDWGI